MITHSDEALDRWAEIYQRNAVRRRLGISYEQFLQAPEAYLRRATVPAVPEPDHYYDLLPAQQQVSRRLLSRLTLAELAEETGQAEAIAQGERIEDDLIHRAMRHAGCAYQEKLSHHRYEGNHGQRRDHRRVPR